MTTSDWALYVPTCDGVPPPDYTAGDAWEFRGCPDWPWLPDEEPYWYKTLEYRYRPTATATARELTAWELEELDRSIGPASRTPEAAPAQSSLPEDDATRNEYPMFDGLVAYFPNALAEVARVSKIGNDQHNPGEPMHWDRAKSTDHGNKIMRHLVDAGKLDARGVRHTARLAWRALAMLQAELEAAGAPLSRGSTPAPTKPLFEDTGL